MSDSERERQVKALAELLKEASRCGVTYEHIAECLVAAGVRVMTGAEQMVMLGDPAAPMPQGIINGPSYHFGTHEEEEEEDNHDGFARRYEAKARERIVVTLTAEPGVDYPPTLAGVPITWILPTQAAAKALDTQEARMEAYRLGSMDEEIRNQIVGTKLDSPPHASEPPPGYRRRTPEELEAMLSKLDTPAARCPTFIDGDAWHNCRNPAAMGICARCQLPTPENQLVDGRCGPCREELNKE